MSVHRAVVVDDLEYDFAPDDPELLARRTWALATARAVDEITGEALQVPIRATIEQDGILAKTGDDATIALIARPWDRFPPLFGAAPQIDVRVEAPGYLPLSRRFTLNYDQRVLVAVGGAGSVLTLNNANNLATGQALLVGPLARQEYASIANLGPGANQVTLTSGLANAHGPGDPIFPDVFAPAATVDLLMHRTPVVIRGRVARRSASTGQSTGVAGATVTVVDFWRTRALAVAAPQGAMTTANPAQQAFAVSLSPGALAARAAGGNAGNFAPLAPVAGEEKLLRRDAEPEDDQIELSDCINLGVPQLIRVDAGDPSAAELQTVAAVVPTGAQVEPAQVTLDLPLRNEHPAGARVQRFGAPGAPPVPLTLRDDVLPGDACIFLDNAIPGTGWLRLTGGGATDEYQTFTELVATADGDGYFRLPAITRMAQLQIDARDGVNPVLAPFDFQPDYTDRDPWLEVTALIP